MDWDEPFGDKDYEVDSAAEYMRSFDDDIEEIKRTRRSFFGPNVLELCQAADIVFMGLHGSNGEDGKVQATFDLLGIRYTGTGYLSSALAMDKGLTKKDLSHGSGTDTEGRFHAERKLYKKHP